MKKNNNPLLNISSKTFAFTGLIVILAILLFQSAFSLFVETTNEGLTQIDIVFRTALSSIFGYLMSMVSASDFKLKKRNLIVKPNKNTIGFSAQKDEIITSKLSDNKPEVNEVIDVQAYKADEKSGENIITTNVQIITLIVVCVFCLITMLVVRNFSELIVASSSNSVTISMYRDIISGSVGALIGLSRSNS